MEFRPSPYLKKRTRVPVEYKNYCLPRTLAINHSISTLQRIPAALCSLEIRKQRSPPYSLSDAPRQVCFCSEDFSELDEAACHIGNDKIVLGHRRYNRDFGRTFKGLSLCNGPESLSKRPRFDANVLKMPKNEMQASGNQVKTRSSKTSRREVISAICKFFYHAGVPFHEANSQYLSNISALRIMYMPIWMITRSLPLCCSI